ncbi:hypothetical protein XH80_25590 [Bradyrhizobium sp. CCBAU 45384]|nr:hypothetical protein [Bradyrhizobium sp. CCBAU 45384]
MRRGKRRDRTGITPEAVEIFRRAHKAPTHADRIALAEALGRSKFAASPFDSEPRSLIGGDRRLPAGWTTTPPGYSLLKPWALARP